MSEDNDTPLLQPQPSGAWVRERRERQEREYRDNETLSLRELMQQSIAKAEQDEREWSALPCGGKVENVGQCSDQFAETCGWRDKYRCARFLARQVAREAANRRAATRDHARRNNVPERILRAVYDAPAQDTEARRLLAAAFEQQGVCIVVLSGGVGCGKSCAAALWAVEHGARFITASDLAKSSAYDEADSELVRAGALVIDDLGTEYADKNGYFLSRLDSLINHRYANCLATVITTNLGIDEFKAYGERVVDRLREAGKFVRVGGESMRKRK